MNIFSLKISHIIKVMGSLLIALMLTSCTDAALLEKQVSGERAKQVLGKFTLVNPKLDLVFIVDDSGSMTSHQDRLADQLDTFVDAFIDSDVDYRLFVVPMSKNGKLIHQPPFLTANNIDVRAAAKKRLRVGSDGGWLDESTFDTISGFLNINSDLLRDDAVLNFVYLSDEDEQSERWTPKSFYNYLLNFKKDPEKLLIFGVMHTPKSQSLCSSSWISEDDYRIYFEFMQTYGNGFLDICSPTYGEDLSKLAEILSEKLSVNIHLLRPPIKNTIEVLLGPYTIPQNFEQGWYYNPATQSIHVNTNFITEPPLYDDDIKKYKISVKYRYF